MSTLDQILSSASDEDQQQQIVDYKMVTFTLGGKDYGVDIMSVKEIYKAEDVTPVPNTAPFVRGVFNLRGEIISIIDLRVMFNLPVIERAPGEVEDVIFVKVEDHLVGVVVDFINDVVGVDSSTIQPPHPLFGDINIKYISGVVEYDERLFIILDTDAIFGIEGSVLASQPTVEEIQAVRAAPIAEEIPQESLSYTFITETLFTFKSFVASEINEEWLKKRFGEWQQIKGTDSAAVQLKSAEDANEFLRGFASAHSAVFWSDDLAAAFENALPETEGVLVSAWDVGCGQGHEAYSVTAILKKKYTGKQVKVWAHDSDLLKVANAPNMVFRQSELPPWIREHLQEGANGWSFKKEIGESVLFEYHDVLNENPLPPVNAIIARDILSFLSNEGRAKLLADFADKLVSGGILIVGDNERISGGGWAETETAGLRWYTKTV